MSDVAPYTKVGRVASGDKLLHVGEDDFRARWFDLSEKEGYTDCERG